MLDEYIWGEARRVSPEAPVPVVEVQRRSYAAGGTANVAANITALGGRARLVGLVGADAQGAVLAAELRARGVETDGLIIDASRPTTTKTRVLARNHQIVRLDCEDRSEPARSVLRELVRWIDANIGNADACVVSDYSKGAVSVALAQYLIRLGREAGKPLVVDPKNLDFRRYRGASVITPNVAEARRAAGGEPDGDADLCRIGRQLLRRLVGAALLITRGAEGMSLFLPGRDPLHIPVEARSVFDVTGAGDTVVATLALALAAGQTLETAASLANRAAGIAVGKLGAASVTPDELFGLIPSQAADTADRPLSPSHSRPSGPPLFA